MKRPKTTINFAKADFYRVADQLDNVSWKVNGRRAFHIGPDRSSTRGDGKSRRHCANGQRIFDQKWQHHSAGYRRDC